ncbi:MAG: hypothetical protein RMJ17_02500 [Candidatus Aenigmarchaeota archaeon]|nr:hypothetical protein [Candidatus Aenigmarchaeota archaeon]MDW8149443.1 hypothetical protein [Candidatus Aenigmarchaeota archaeon]
MAFVFPYQSELFEFYLPFLIVFSVVYALLAKSKIFGTDKPGKVANLVISLGFALYVAASPFVKPFVNFLTVYFGQGVVVILTIVLVLMMFALFIGVTGFGEIKFEKAGKFIAGTVIIIGILLFLSSGGLNLVFPGISNITWGTLVINEGTIAAIIMILVTVGIIVFLMTGGGEKK